MNILRTIMNTLVYFIFLYVPDPLLYFLISVVAYLRSLYRIVAHFKMEVELYDGYRSNYPVKMLWIGTDEMKTYILERLYDSAYQVTRLKSTNFINLRKTLDNLSTQSDLIYVELDSLLPHIKGFKRIPKFLLTWMRVEERNSSEYRRIMRHIEKNGIELKEFKISKNIDQFRLFYDQLYAPYISARWGEHRVEPFDSLKRFYAKGGVLLAYLKEEAIAGCVFFCQGNTFITCKYGVRNPKDKLHRSAASFLSHLKYAADNNFTYYSAFHAKPFLNDSVFRYKRDCGLRVQIEKRNYYFDKDLYLRVVNYNSGVVDFLSKEPFIFVNNKNLVASLLCPAEVSNLVAEIVRQYQRYCTSGIAQYGFYVARELTDHEKREIYQRCGVLEEENVLRFINYNTNV